MHKPQVGIQALESGKHQKNQIPQGFNNKIHQPRDPSGGCSPSSSCTCRWPRAERPHEMDSPRNEQLQSRDVSHLHVLWLNVVLHLRLWDGVAAVGAYFNISSTVDFMGDEIDCRNILFAGRKSLRLLSRNTLNNKSKQLFTTKRQC